LASPLTKFDLLPGTQRDDDRHFAALGRLVSTYASAEAAVYVVARHLSKLDDAKARVIFAGMRLSDLTERVRRMMEIDAASRAEADDILSCLAQLDLIGERRNHLVHWLAEYASGHMRVTNLLTAKSMSAIEVKFFTLEDLDQMTLDCFAILMRLLGLVVPDEHKDAELVAALQQPWRYKPAPPHNPKKRSRPKAPPKRQRQRDA